MSASEALVAAAMAALREVPGLTGVHEAAPVQAAVPCATVDAGLETDWGHKSGAGRELRLTVTLRDQGERPRRLRALAADVQQALGGLGPDLSGWRLVTLVFVRSICAPDGTGKWVLALDFRARLLAV
jgi:hypothetical protein